MGIGFSLLFSSHMTIVWFFWPIIFQHECFMNLWRWSLLGRLSQSLLRREKYTRTCLAQIADVSTRILILHSAWSFEWKFNLQCWQHFGFNKQGSNCVWVFTWENHYGITVSWYSRKTYTFLNAQKYEKLHIFSKGWIPTLNKEKNFCIYLMLDFIMSVCICHFHVHIFCHRSMTVKLRSTRNYQCNLMICASNIVFICTCSF